MSTKINKKQREKQTERKEKKITASKKQKKI